MGNGYEWNSEKNKKNIQKHRISFESATEVFCDTSRYETIDFEHSSLEETRYKVLGCTRGFKIISLSYTEQDNGNKNKIMATKG